MWKRPLCLQVLKSRPYSPPFFQLANNKRKETAFCVQKIDTLSRSRSILWRETQKAIHSFPHGDIVQNDINADMDVAKTDKRLLLSNGQCIPIIGLGMFQNKNETEVVDAVTAAIKEGYRHIDTAFVYRNEAFVGRALQKAFKDKTVKREDMFIVTKLPMNGMRPENVEYFFNKSLTDLQLDYIDLYLIHHPVAARRTDDDFNFFPMVDGVFDGDHVGLVETWQAMENLVHQGLVKSIGVSNFNSEQVQIIYDGAKIKPAVLQVECHAYLPQFELQDYLKPLKIAITAYAPIGAPGREQIKDEQKLVQEPKLKSICENYGKTPAQILLRYLIQRGIIVIPKSVNPERIKENIEIFDFEISEEDMEELKSLACGKRYFTFEDYRGFPDHPEYPFRIPF